MPPAGCILKQAISTHRRHEPGELLLSSLLYALRSLKSLSVIENLRARMRRELFQPSVLSFFFGPDYIIRRGLFRAIQALSPRISGRVLDFGCGSKPYQDLFSNATSYLGVDLEHTGHDHRDSKVDIFYDGKVLPFPDAAFDAVVSFEVFEHVFDLQPILAEIRRVTTDSGHLLISFPFAWPEHEVPYDFARYTSFGMTHVLHEAGYDIVELKKTTSHLLAAFQILIAYLTPANRQPRVVRYLYQFCVILPCTALAHVLDALLPRKYGYFCNIVVLAKKRASSQ